MTRWLSVVSVVILLISACSSNPSESAEYRQLLDQVAELETAQQQAETRAQQTEDRIEELIREREVAAEQLETERQDNQELGARYRQLLAEDRLLYSRLTEQLALFQASVSETEPFIRACGTDQGGSVDRADWGEDAVVAGSFAFLNGRYLTDPARSAEYAPSEGGLYGAQKALAAVDPGVVVTVVVPLHERETFSLLYDSATKRSGREVTDQVIRDLFAVSDGDVATTFIACNRDSDTQFAGAVIVAGDRCVDLDFYFGNEVEPLRQTVSFGTGDCD